jgi:hypothetical protein
MLMTSGDAPRSVFHPPEVHQAGVCTVTDQNIAVAALERRAGSDRIFVGAVGASSPPKILQD